MKNAVFWDVTPYEPNGVTYQRKAFLKLQSQD
jgi:hypothetical protein